jgi:peptide/nickel transport system substrate-binding protein
MKKLFFLVILVFVLVGCTGLQRSDIPQKLSLPNISEADPDGVLVFSLGGEVTIINPILSSDTASSALEGAIFNGLVTIDKNLDIIPELAEFWKAQDDGKIWYFYLRDDVMWHDGKPFTAADAKFTFDSILDPKVNSVRRSDYIIDGQEIRFNVISPYVLQAVLPKPFAPFLSRMAMGIIPKHILEGQDINRASFNRKPIGTGPFKFAQWKVGEGARVLRNDAYFKSKPLLKEIVFKIIPDENARLVALEAGEIDETGIPPKDFKKMKSAPRINVFEYDALTYTYLGFNLANPIFADKKVRQALAYAVNKNQLVNLIFRGLASPAHSPSAPIAWSYNPEVEKYPFNLNKAKQLLTEAGYPNGFEFTCLVNQGNKEREKAATVLQQHFKQIGVKMNIQVMEWSSMIKILNAPDDPKKFDAVIIGWALGIDPDSYSIWHSSQYPSGLNFIKYNNPEIDRLLEKGRTTMDKEGRKDIYGKIQKFIADDQPYIFLWYPKVISGVRERVGGLSEPGPAGLFLELEKVFVSK